MQNAASLQGSSGNAWPGFMTAKGLPNGALTAGIFGTISLPSNIDSTTVLVLAWKGTATNASGAFQIGRGSPGFTIVSDPGSIVKGGVSFNLNASGVDGYVEFTCNGPAVPTSFTMTYVSGSTFTNISQLIVCRKSDYAVVLNPSGPGDLITDDYVNAWIALKPSKIRMLSIFGVNDNCNVTQKKYMADWKNGVFLSSIWHPNLWAGDAAGTNAYTIAGATDTPTAYTHGEIIQCNFPNPSNSTPITINVASRGVVPLITPGGSALSSGGVTTGPRTLIYDDLLGGYLYYATPYGNGLGIYPVELCVALCNRVGCGMWLNLPTHVTTKSSTMEPIDSVTQLVKYVSDNLAGGDFNLEYSNEVWNAAGAIGANTSFAAVCAIALGFPSDNNRQPYGFYAYKACVVQPLAKAAWTSSRTLRMVDAFQAFGPSSGTNTYRLKGSDLASVANGGQGNALWVSYTGDANFRSFPNRPVDLCDTLAYAAYYSGAQCQNFDAAYTGLSSAKTITGISSASPGVITFNADPGYPTGSRVNLASIAQTGTPTVSGMNVTLTKLSATTYSMYTDATLATPIDTTSFAYTSGGTAKSYPTISGLTAWADQYALGDAVNQAAAIIALDADIQGSNTGQTTSALVTNIYPTWETVAAGFDGARPAGKSNLTIELYESAFESVAPATASCTILGIATSYSSSILTLLTAYKNSNVFYNRARKVLLQFAAASASSGRFVAGCWFIFSSFSQWSMKTGSDIYSSNFQSYDAVKHLNAGKRRLLVKT